ncbi:glycosyltransferase [Terriglobus roseus]|uniref:Glycosyltransferase involved in cell wall bisynthesis n=1 Tax=Terriglobus roseus TaxID=392734 RepID=A0A1H4SH30_9BACT|nr:glycosyltransferase [Terriglobus roseus]SEC43496.1 Glycosyltransferase involved in cell wall bisynthesis [Terriglobus roseus]
MSHRIVLHLIASNFIGGPEKQILYHAETMQSSAYDIVVASFRDSSDEPEIVTYAARIGLRAFCLSGDVIPATAQLIAYLRRHKNVLVCTHGFKANVLGFFATSIAGSLHVAFVRGWTAETWRVAVYEWLERLTLAHAQRVVCVSRLQQQQLTARRTLLGYEAPRHIPNAMLPPRCDSDGSAPLHVIKSNAFIFGAVGRLSKEKGHSCLLHGFADLLRRLPMGSNIRLLVLGDGRERQMLEEMAGDLGIDELVTFAGFQSDCRAWMKSLDCLVQPSLTEGTPNSVLEALTLHIPVIATSVGGVPDLVRHEHNGLLIKPSSPKILSDAMYRVYCDPSLRARLAAGCEEIETEYGSEMQRARLIQLYDSSFCS